MFDWVFYNASTSCHTFYFQSIMFIEDDTLLLAIILCQNFISRFRYDDLQKLSADFFTDQDKQKFGTLHPCFI